MLDSIHQYVDSNIDKFTNELISFLKIPSVSTDPERVQYVQDAAKFVQQSIQNLGLTAEIIPTKGHPIVFGEHKVDESLPTILVYGHYDVQPEDPMDLWTSPPFEPVVKNGRVYARGSADDKGQMYMHIKALETLKAIHADDKANIKFLFEGEEEVGSEHLEDFVKNNKEKLTADIVLISDTSMIATETPSITVGLKGLSYMEVEVTGPNRDLHSGVYGGTVMNPVNALCQMIASMKDENNRITIPGFYDKVVELSPEERAALNLHPFDEEEFKQDLGIKDVSGEAGYNTIERGGIRPTLDVNGIWGGYTGKGAKTVLPSKAYAKISMRLVPDQEHKEISRLFEEYFRSLAPKGVQVKVDWHHGAKPAVTPTKSAYYQAASQAFESVWGKEPIPTRDGGSIPVVALFNDELGINSVLLGFGLDSDAIHSPNESFKLEHYKKGIKTIASFYLHL